MAQQAGPAQKAPDSEAQLKRAALLMQRGKFMDAEQILARLLRADPKEANALNMLGVIRGEQDRFEEAEKLLRRSLEINPKLIGAIVNLGYLYRRMQRPDEALATFLRAAKIQPRDPEVLFNIASLKTESGEFVEALSTLEKIPKRDRSPGYPLLAARCYLGLGRIENLRSDLREMHHQLEPFPVLLGELAQLLINANLVDDTIAFLEGIKGPAIGSFPATFNLGEAYQIKGDLAKAAELYQLALNVEPRSVETLKRLAVIAQKQEKWEDMFHYLTDAKQLAPNSTSILYGFALAALRTNHLGDAQFTIRQAMDLEPNNPQFVYFYGITQMSLSDVQPAIETFRRYVQMKADDAMGQLGFAFALYEGAQYDEALEALGKCRRLNPSLTEPFYYLGMIAHNQGDSAKALDYLGRVIEKEPNHAAAHTGVGMVYFKLREYQKAREELELAIRLNPEHSNTHYQLSQVLMRLGDTERAQRELELYSELKNKAEEKRTAAGRLLASTP